MGQYTALQIRVPKALFHASGHKVGRRDDIKILWDLT